MAIEKPASRVEELLLGIYQNGSGGGGGGGEGAKVYRGTTEYWNAQTIPSELNALYIYTDYDTDEQGLVPALKIGDGVHSVPTLRFISAGSAAEITDEDVDSWNNKVTAAIDHDDAENLIISH